NGKPNQIHSSPKDFACDNTYEDMQQTIRNAQNMGRQTCEQQTSGDFGNNRSDKPKSMKSRLPFLVNGWPTDVVYDAKEEVATIEQSSQEAATAAAGWLGLLVGQGCCCGLAGDAGAGQTEQPRSRHCCCGLAGSASRTGLLRAGWGCWCGSVALPLSRGHSRQVSNLLLLLRVGWGCWCGPVSVAARSYANGKVELVSGPIQPIDVLSSNGRRYFVEFNELHQPLRKGGHILVKFLGYIAKMGNYCPLGALTWHKVEKKLKCDIIKKMREHFIIPNDEVYDKLALQRVDKYWRHYKHELKKTFFHPDKKTKEQHYDPVPSGHTSNDWIKLVNHWFSPKGQEAEHGKPMGLIEAWERSHVRKDGSFVEGTATEDFLLDAKAKVETMKLSAPSTSCKEDLEDEAFHDVMNGGKIPERPQGFGFGVKRSDVYGVRGLVRKEGYSKGKMKFVELDLNSNSSPCNKKKEDLEKRNEELSMKYNENNNLLKTVVTQFSEFLDVMRNGNASVQLIDAAQSTLAMATQQVLILPLKFSRIIEEKKSF
ncbi:DNA replication licensing factor mcm4, partial [Bienertia sinuspersici]